MPEYRSISNLEWSDKFPLGHDIAERARKIYGRFYETQATVAARLGISAWRVSAMLRKVSFVAYLPEKDIYEEHAKALGVGLSDYIGDLVAAHEEEFFRKSLARK